MMPIIMRPRIFSGLLILNAEFSRLAFAGAFAFRQNDQPKQPESNGMKIPIAKNPQSCCRCEPFTGDRQIIIKTVCKAKPAARIKQRMAANFKVLAFMADSGLHNLMVRSLHFHGGEYDPARKKPQIDKKVSASLISMPEITCKKSGLRFQRPL